MAGIDTSIYAPLLQPKSVEDYQAERDQRQQNALLQMLRQQQVQQGQGMLQDQQRARDMQDRIYQGLQGLGQGATDDQRIGVYEQNGDFTGADKIRQSVVTRNKGESEIQAQKIAGYKNLLTMQGELANRVLANPSPDYARAAVQQMAALHKQLGFGDMDTSAEEAQIASFRTPDDVKKWAAGHALSAEKLIPQLSTHNTGGATVTLAMDPVTGATQQTNSVTNTQSPDNKATVGASYANAAAMRDQAQATRDAAKIQTGVQNEQHMRQEFEALPEVKNLKQAMPAYSAIEDAAKRNSTQSDINIVYGIAKLYDPNSVVREGEYATVANSPNIPERIKGYAQYLANGGRLTPEVKAQILQEARGRIGTYQEQFDNAKESYRGIATRSGVRPENVLTEVKTSAGVPSEIADILKKHGGKP